MRALICGVLAAPELPAPAVTQRCNTTRGSRSSLAGRDEAILDVHSLPWWNTNSLLLRKVNEFSFPGLKRLLPSHIPRAGFRLIHALNSTRSARKGLFSSAQIHCEPRKQGTSQFFISLQNYPRQCRGTKRVTRPAQSHPELSPGQHSRSHVSPGASRRFEDASSKPARQRHEKERDDATQSAFSSQ